jgi:DNA-binding phage protein
VRTEPFDAVLYLTAPEAQADLLRDALASGDAGYVDLALAVVARARSAADVAREGGSRLFRDAVVGTQCGETGDD